MKRRREALSATKQALLARRLRARDAVELASIARAGGSFPLSSGQERLWFVDQYEPNTSTYNVPHAVRWRGPLDAAKLERVVRELVARHEVLRARFEVEHGAPVQRFAPVDAWRLAIVDVRDHADPDAEAARRATEEAVRPFDLARGPLFRATLVRVRDDDHVLVFAMHHAITDGWSIRVLHRELVALYATQPSPLAPTALTYVDYAVWQRRLLAGAHHDAELAFWKRRLADAPVLELPADRPRPPSQTYRGARHVLAVPAATSHGLAALALDENASLPIALLGAYAALLARYAGQRDVVVGTPIANRTHFELEPLVGFFVNMLAIRIELDDRPTTRTLLRHARERMLEAQEHGQVPFDRVVEHLRPARDRSRHPVFQAAFHVNEPVDTTSPPGVQLAPFDVELAVAKYDLELSIDLAGGDVRCSFDFNADLFERGTIERMATHFATLLAAMVVDPDRPLDELELLDAEDRAELSAWNATTRVYPGEACVHALIETQVDRTPDAVALIFEGRTLTYRELDERANQLAHQLLAAGAGRERPIGVCLERSPAMVIAVLAILKTGASYLPLDPAYPPARVRAILADSGCALVVDRAWLDAHEGGATDRPSVEIHERDAAYVIFTSGSTGRPKGVVIEHASLRNRLLWPHAFGFSAADRFLFKTPYTFDVSVFELLYPFVVGGCLVVAREDGHRDPQYLAELIRAERVTYAHFVPSMLGPFLDAARAAPCPSLRRVICSGEALSAALVRDATEVLDAELYNLYGPTEATVDVTWWRCDDAEHTVPIGVAAANTRLYVLDAQLRRVPIGVAGELYLAGVQLARGYGGRPDLTAERFLPDPFHAGERMYRTGDLARRRLDGAVEYLGRIDHQVKLRGLRIELGEIEAVLRTDLAVADAAVAVRADVLVAYVVPSAPGMLDTDAIATTLRAALPDYMVPTVFVALDALPLTSSGKLDRKALPAPDLTSAEAYVAPRDATEHALVALWQRLLGVERVGVHDDFFALGGHSLLATRVIAAIRAELELELPVRAVFVAPTIAGLAARITELRASGARATLPLLRATTRPERPALSFAQERLWFLHELEPESRAYHLGDTRRVDHVDAGALRRALTSLVARHEILRTTFPALDGVPYQRVHPPTEWLLPVEDARALDGDGQARALARLDAELHRPFDLVAGPLLRTALVRITDDTDVLVVVLHHIITDGWSQAVLWRELWELYDGLAAARPALPVQFADYAAWQRAWLAGPELDRQLAFWTERLRGAPEETALPLARPRSARTVSRAHHVDARIDADVAAGLRVLARREGATLFMVLLAGFRALLARATGQEDLVIGTPIANRNHREVEDLVGFFVNTLALRGEVHAGDAFTALLAREKANALAAYDHQDAPFELIVDALHLTRRLDLTPLFQVWFVHQNTPREADARGVSIEPAGAERASKFDLTLYSFEDGDTIHLSWHYDAALWDAATIDELVAAYHALLADVAAHPARRVDALVPDVTPPPLAGATPATLWDRFADAVARHPDRVAVRDDARAWTYAELHARAEAIAAHLDDADAGERVACALTHGGDMIAGVLGVLAGGRAYVALDPTHPLDRSAFVLRDSGARTVLCDAATAAFAAQLAGDARVVRADAAAPGRQPRLRPRPDDLAYCLYTSGSTGRPKGVLQRHTHVVHLLDAYRRRLALVPDDVVTLLSTLAFDAAVVDMFATLLAGATLCTYELRARGIADLPAVLAERGVTIYHSTPTVWRELAVHAPRLAPSIRAVVLGGEEVVPADLDRVRAACAPATILVNGYGMTECSWALMNVVAPGEVIDRATVPLGEPLDGIRVTLRTPLGPQRFTHGVGTICIESPYVAAGYHDRPDDTAAAFPAPGTYLTTDRGRLLADGGIEFAGRFAHQIKLRGFRIDLREVEAVLAAHPDAGEAAAAVHEGPRGPELVGYIVTRADHPAPELAELRDHLRAALPDYMIPAAIVPLPALPTGATGKLDRSALPAPDADAFPRDVYVAPRDATEHTLADIWCELLGVERVGIGDDFFDLGGHSLLAMRVVAHVRRRLDVELSVRDVFETPTIEGIARAIAPRRADVPAATTVSAHLPVSFVQRRLWFLHQLEPASTAYILESVDRHEGIDIDVLRSAFEALASRHDILRTTFPARGGEPYQLVHPPAPWVLPVDDARALDDTARAEMLARAEAEQHRPWDLAAGPLVRTRAVRVTGDVVVLHVTVHHLLVDGDTFEVLRRELWACYRALAAGRPIALRPVRAQYAAYAAWERAWLSGAELERLLAYWCTQLRDAPEHTELPTKGPRPPRQTFGGRMVIATLPATLTSALRTVAREHGATLFMAVAAALRALLVRYTGQPDLVLGTAINHRASSEFDDTLGNFAHTLLLRTETLAEDTFASLLARERTTVLAALDHVHAPFDLVVNAVGVERTPGRMPLFQVMYVHALDLPDAPVSEATAMTTTLDLTITSVERAGALELRFLYNTDLFDHALVEQLGRHLQRLIDHVTHHAHLPLASLELLDEDDHAHLRAWGTGPRARDTAGVLTLIAHQVARAPEAIAVEHASTRLTYAELAARGDRVAGWLARHDVTCGDRVAICVERSADMVAAVLGVLQLGAAYVPIDPEYPAARRALIVRDTAARVVLDDAALRDALTSAHVAPRAAVAPEDVAYIIYTSGSTGTPKGVRVSHGNLANYLAAMRGSGVRADDTVAAIASLAFDAHVIDLLLPLANGARIVVADRDTTRDGERLARLLDERGVTFMFATPATWRALLATGWRPSRSLRVHAGGEAVPPDLAATLLAHAESVWNGYGPTETTVYVSCTRLAPGEPVTIGRPLPGVRAYVLDAAGHLVPTGVAGELCVGGAGVALGYHARPALTAERFVPDPFVPTARMYRTGDRARWTHDGRLEYLGRVDTQIKLRGLRIELGEIEAALRALPHVDDAVVVRREDAPGDPQLVAYLATRAPLDDAAARVALRATLPAYMVPTALVAMPALPRTPNGKLDRRALPAPDLTATAYVAPRDATEAVIARTWGELLGVDRVGVDDDFFALGGHSLLVMPAISRLRHDLGVALSVHAFYEAPTVAELAARVAELRARVGGAPPLVPVPRGERPPLSFAQERLWFLHQLEPDSRAYHVGDVRRLEALDVDALRRAFEHVAMRHETLRTSFPAVDGVPYQRVHPPGPWTLAVDDARSLGEVGQRDRIAARHRALSRPFDLAAGPPLRTELVRVADDAYVLLVVMHHIIADGGSFPLLWDELWTAYDALAAGAPALARPPLSIQYADFAMWQRAWLAGPELAHQLAFWTAQLAGAPEDTALPFKGPRPAVQTFAGGALDATIPAALVPRLRMLARDHDATLFMTFAAALRAVLARYTGQADLVLGAPIDNRSHTELAGLLGMFVNTLALRGEVRPDDSFASLLAREKATALAAYDHQHTPFELVVDALGAARSLGHAPVFQVMYQHQDTAPYNSERGVQVDTGAGISAPFDLSIVTWDSGAAIDVTLIYNTDLFEPALIAQLVGHFTRLLELVAAAPAAPLAAHDLLSAAEHAQLAAWNATSESVDDEPFVIGMIEAQVDRAPDAIAVTFEGASLTYRELDARANQLAHHLLAAGAGRDRPIGVCLERSPAMVIAVLAILKTGAAYLPLDPAYPPARVRAILADSGCALVVDRAWVDAHDDGATDRPRIALDGGDAAYVLFTSGSTGRPKGVVIDHAALRNQVRWPRALGFDASDRFVLKTPFTFDVSVFELINPFTIGARLVIAREGGHRDPAYLADLIRAEHATYVHFVPSMLGAFLDVVRTAPCPSLRRVVCSGEALPAPLARDALEVLDVELYNLYGPTEATVHVSLHRCDGDPARAAVPIGVPVPNTRFYILDPLARPAPIGVPGELYLAGVQLARGYAGRPDLTAERFVPDPFHSGERMYRTGDLARFLPDGQVEYLGRLDDQVKLRGQRIELAEITAVLHTDAAVADAAVVVRGDRLVAYVVPRAPAALDADSLTDTLRAALPDYMVPAVFVPLAALPLTASGKLDRKALPAPALASREAYVAPRTAQEVALAELWRELLGVERVGIHDDFFALGGHSLLATRLVSRIRVELAAAIPLRAVFEAPTLTALAARITALAAAPADASPPLVAAPRGAHPPLSFAQQRLWFLHQLEPEGRAYHLADVRHIEGLDVVALRRAFAALVARHEILRTSFPAVDGVPFQDVHPPAPVPLTIDVARDLDDAVLARVAADQHRPFDLAAAPPWRAHLVRVADRAHVLFVTLHHILTDGWSQDILWRELGAYYAAFAAGAPAPVLPQLAIQFADVAAWQRAWLTGDALDRQLAFWTERLRGAPAETALPLAGPRPPRSTHLATYVHDRVDATVAASLRALAQREGTTLFMVLLAGLRALLARVTGQGDLVIGTPIANRTHRELEGLIGMFVNTLALRGEVRRDDSFGALLAREKAGALAAYEHQDTPFELIVDALRLPRRLDLTPLFQVWFVHQNTPDTATALGEHLALAGADAATKFDLALYSTEAGEAIELAWSYNVALWDAATIDQLVAAYHALLADVAAHPERRIDALWPAATPPLVVATAEHATLWDRFIDVAARHPDRVAVREAERAWTYGELHARAEAIAAHLDDVDAGARVACALAHGGEMVAGLLGVLAGGRAYVPLDPTHPLDRSAFVLRDSGARALLCDATTAAFAARLAGDARVVRADEAAPGPQARRGRPRPDDLAYCLYTSGSTGRPKGVLQRHAHVVHLLDGYCARLAVGPGDVLTLLSTFAFDAAVVDVFSTLLAGATLCAYELRARGLAELPAALAEHGVTIFHSTPTVWRELAAHAPTLAPSIRAVVLGGEEVVPADLDRVHAACSTATVLVNGYGMTECSWALLNVVAPGGVIDRATVPLGAPLDGVRVALETPLGPQRVVHGVGTICIDSPYVADGYHARPDDTAAAFPAPGRYVTTDLGRLLPDGRVEFAGRLAHQVKLRGFRIDLREIEAVLADHPDVHEAAVALHDGPRGAELVAYAATTASADALRAHLAAQLPDYMVPAIVMLLAALPLGPTGKLDRSALPAPAMASSATYVAPRDEVEATLARVWSELLGVERVGAHDDFFALGGHSLLAVRLIAELQRTLGVRVSLRALFEAPTIEALATRLSRARRDALHDARPAVRRSPARRAPALAPQRGSYFVSRAGQRNALRLGRSMWLDGDLDVDALHRAFEALRARHEILRTRYFEQDGQVWQEVLGTIEAPILQRADLTSTPAEAQAQRADALHAQYFQRPYDLARGELVRALLVRFTPTRHRLSFAIHHISSDVQTLQIFDDELCALWRAFAAGASPEAALPPPPAHYLDLVDYLGRLASTAEGARQRAFWDRRLAGATPIALPTDLPRASVDDARRAAPGGIVGAPAGVVGGTLGPETAAAAQRTARTENTTVMTVLLAALATLLTELTGQHDLVLTSPLQYRHLPGFERSLGYFANPLVMRVSTAATSSFEELVARTSVAVAEAYDHGDEDLLARAPELFRVLFNFHYTHAVIGAPAAADTPAVRSAAPFPAPVERIQGYDLIVHVAAYDDAIYVGLNYLTELFSQAAATDLLDRYLATLRRVLDDR